MNQSEMKEEDRQQPQERFALARQQSEKGWARCASGCARGPRTKTRILAIVIMLIVLITVAMAFILYGGAV